MSDNGARTMQDLKAAADAGDRQAQFELGRRYFRGDGVPRNAEMASHWLQRAANGGHTVARIYLAELTGEPDHAPRRDAGFERWLTAALVDLRQGEAKRRDERSRVKSEQERRSRTVGLMIAAILLIGAIAWWWRGGF